MKTYIQDFGGDITQNFGDNANPLYSSAGYKGHTGTDVVVGYGTPIHAYFPMKVYKVLTVDHPANDGTGFTGVFGIVDTPLETFEILYGHCDPTVKEGDMINVGDVIGTEANHGEIYSNGIQITLAMQKAGDHRGSHRHIQKRPVYKDSVKKYAGLYLSAYGDGNEAYFDGNYYEYVNWLNGYNGCVNVTLPLFIRDLRYIPLFGSRGFDVECLQRALAFEGFAKDYTPTAYFGAFTKRDVVLLQSKYEINPTGYFGPITRNKMNDIYS